MLRKNEIARLRLQKDLLVLQSNANRLLLKADWQRLRSPEIWANETGNLARRHPIWTTLLTAAAGTLAAQAMRKSGGIASGLGRLGTFASVAMAGWKLFRRKKSEP